MSVKMINMEFEIAKEQVIQGTTNYVCSQKYLEMVVKVSVLNILYHRLPVPKDIFYSKEFNSIPYKVVRNEYVDVPLIQLYRKWIRGFKDAFRKKYLKELVLFFFNDATQEIEENFTFKFGYEDVINKEKANTDLTDPTEYLLKTLLTLKDLPKLDGKTLSLHVEMFYVSETPTEYKPAYFVEKDYSKTLKSKMNSDILDTPLILAKFCTKFHYFMAKYYRKPGNSQFLLETESESLVGTTNKKKRRSEITAGIDPVKKLKIRKTIDQTDTAAPDDEKEESEEQYLEKDASDTDGYAFETACIENDKSVTVDISYEDEEKNIPNDEEICLIAAYINNSSHFKKDI